MDLTNVAFTVRALRTNGIALTESLTLTYKVGTSQAAILAELAATSAGPAFPAATGYAPVNAVLETLSDDGQTRVIRASMPATYQRSFLRLLVTH